MLTGAHIPPLKRSQDPVVRFFGAQNAQIKISRDWCAGIQQPLEQSNLSDRVQPAGTLYHRSCSQPCLSNCLTSPAMLLHQTAATARLRMRSSCANCSVLYVGTSPGILQACRCGADAVLFLPPQLASLITRLTPATFQNPLLTVTTTLAGHHVPRSIILEWLTVSVRDLTRAALVEPRK